MDQLETIRSIYRDGIPVEDFTLSERETISLLLDAIDELQSMLEIYASLPAPSLVPPDERNVWTVVLNFSEDEWSKGFHAPTAAEAIKLAHDWWANHKASG